MRLRPFDPTTDFEPAKQLVPPEWLHDECTDEELSAHRELALANQLRCATYAIVAEATESDASKTLVGGSAPEPGTLLGLVLGRFDDIEPPAASVEHWQSIAETSVKLMSAGTDAAKAALSLEVGIPVIHERLHADAGERMPENNELLLFIVSPDARGLGVGTTLLKRFEAHLKARGARSYYLMTDESCSYGYYDRHGFQRIATYRLDEAETDPVFAAVLKETEAFESYYYRRDLDGEGHAEAGNACDTDDTPSAPITYRPFDLERDLNDVIHVMPAHWRPSDPEFTDEMLAHVRRARFAHHAASATFFDVAVRENKIVGAVVGRIGTIPPGTYPEIEELAKAEANAADATPAGAKRKKMRDATEMVDATMVALARTRGLLDEDNELVLFTNVPEVRGQGVGRALLTRFEDYLRANDAHNYHLFTDTDCTYDFYERGGFTRVALCTDFKEHDEIRILLGEASRVPQGDSEEWYVYRYDLTPQVDEL